VASRLSDKNVWSKPNIMTLLNFRTSLQTVVSAAVNAALSGGSPCRQRLRIVTLALAAALCATSTTTQNTQGQRNVPSGLVSNEVLRLTLPDAIKMALRYPESRTPMKPNTPGISPSRATNSRAALWCSARSSPNATTHSCRSSINVSSAAAVEARPTSH
jgi:hypothetical protein